MLLPVTRPDLVVRHRHYEYRPGYVLDRDHGPGGQQHPERQRDPFVAFPDLHRASPRHMVGGVRRAHGRRNVSGASGEERVSGRRATERRPLILSVVVEV